MEALIKLRRHPRLNPGRKEGREDEDCRAAAGASERCDVVREVSGLNLSMSDYPRSPVLFWTKTTDISLNKAASAFIPFHDLSFPARCLVQIIRDRRRRLVPPLTLLRCLGRMLTHSLRTTAAVRICYPCLQENTPTCRNLHHSHHLYLGSRLVRSSSIAPLHR
jgi:hypothetical protein